jgi:hypothetical protein
MALKGRLTSATLLRMLSVRKFSSIPIVTEREIQPCGITEIGPTLENGRDGWSFNIGICGFLKTARLIRLRAAPLSMRTWYSLMLAIVGETISGRFLGQSVASKLISVSIHLRCGATPRVGAIAATMRRRVLMTRQDVMSHEPLNMTSSALTHSLSLDSELE